MLVAETRGRRQMATMEERIAADNAAVADYRAKFGDTAAAQFAADLYKNRSIPPPAPASPFGVFPRWVVVLIALWVALLETSDKLPRLMLSFPSFQAMLAEFQAKPQLVQAQAEIAKQTALVSDIRQKAEAEKAAADEALSRANAEIAKQTALVSEVRQKADADKAVADAELSTANAQIARQTALVSDIRQRAEADKAAADAKIAAATSVYAQRKAKAETEEAEAKARQMQLGAQYLNDTVGPGSCVDQCKGKPAGCVGRCAMNKTAKELDMQ
jgi:hypothetical protein